MFNLNHHHLTVAKKAIGKKNLNLLFLRRVRIESKGDKGDIKLLVSMHLTANIC